MSVLLVLDSNPMNGGLRAAVAQRQSTRLMIQMVVGWYPAAERGVFFYFDPLSSLHFKQVPRKGAPLQIFLTEPNNVVWGL